MTDGFDWGAGEGQRSGGAFEQAYLPDSQKEMLARALLDEFGVTSVHTREPDGELIHRCVLPWHNESKPSASLNYKKLTYRCLGCDSKGGLLWLISTVRSVSGVEARNWLNEQTGIGGADFDLGAMLQFLDAVYAPRARSQVPIPKFSQRVLEPWRMIHPWLTTGVPELGIEGRGIPEVNIMALQVGYAPEYVMATDDNGKPIRTSERIVIPHFWRGDLVGWQSRRISDDGTPKYLATGDFPRDRTVYNYDAKRKHAVVVESPMTVLRHFHHLPIEATFGAAVTDAQVRLLAQHDRVVLWMDNDPAGWKSVDGHEEGEGRKSRHSPGLAERLEPYSSVYVVESEWAADGADMDDATAEQLVADAVPYAVWAKPKRLRCWTCKGHHEGRCQ